MSDPYSIGAIIIAVVTGAFVFINSIKKCKCDKSSGIEMERNAENDVEKTQEFALELVKSLKNTQPSPRKCHSDDLIARKSPKLEFDDYRRRRSSFEEEKVKQYFEKMKRDEMDEIKKLKIMEEEELSKIKQDISNLQKGNNIQSSSHDIPHNYIHSSIIVKK